MKEFVEKLISRLREATYDMEICEEQFDMNSPYFMDVDYKMVKFDDAKTIINELAEEYNNGWIPCSEGLPEVDVYVLCQGSHSMFIACVDSLDNKWRDCHFITRTTVKAWHPLPQPYKPQKLEWKDKVMKHFTNVE
jgi:hypothetical protein